MEWQAWRAGARRVLCWVRHRWEHKTVVRRDEVRYVRRCWRCGAVAVAYHPGDWHSL